MKLIRDRLVLGTKDKDVHVRMFQDPELTLAKEMNWCSHRTFSQSGKDSNNSSGFSILQQKGQAQSQGTQRKVKQM